MSDHEQEKYGRLPLLRMSDLTEAQTAVRQKMSGMLDWGQRAGFRTQTETGELLGPFNAWLYSPALTEGLLVYQQADSRGSSLSPQLREVVILTVGAVWNAAYELYAHQAVARSIGMSTGDIDNLSAGKAPADLGPDAVLVQRFTLAITRDHCVSGELYAEALASFGPKGLVDLISLAGTYMTVSAMLNTFEIPAG